MYARLQIFIQLSPTLTKLCHISATTYSVSQKNLPPPLRGPVIFHFLHCVKNEICKQTVENF